VIELSSNGASESHPSFAGLAATVRSFTNWMPM